ncbi:MAG: BamA/TamA family outer membrane protein [Candidatus Krumholzibacteria bacterium]|nr:BamA/TamA family outer membrane protein [Candidatus Krumholzibacteria bacterium]
MALTRLALNIFFALALTAAWALAQVRGQGARGRGSEFKGWTVRTLEVRGLEPTLAASLKSGLELSERRVVYRTRRVTFYPAVLDEDLQRVRLFMARRGFPYARVEPNLKPIEQGKSLRVVLNITPGHRVTLGAVSIRGVPREIDYVHTLVGGKAFSDDGLDNAVRDLVSALKSAGYAQAEVKTNVEWLDSTSVTVTLEAKPGRAYRFNEVRVTGTQSDLAHLVQKSAGIKRGQPYSPATMDRVRTNLRTLDLFRQVRVSTVDAGDDLLDVQADLLERRPRTVEVGLGYWSDDLLRGRFRWEHRNLLKGGRGVSFVSTASKFSQTAKTSMWWPVLLGARTRATLSLSGERQDEESYELLRVGGGLGLTYRLSLIASGRVGVEVNWVDLERKTDDPEAFVDEGGLLTIFSLRLSRNSANDRVYPSKGHVLWLNAEIAPPGGITENHFALFEGSATRYQRLGDGVVLGGRVNAGLAEPIGRSVDLLPNKRFFAGGSTSMRGFGRRRLGPVDDGGSPIGGELKLTATVELRVPLVWKFGGAAFVDVGQVWRHVEDLDADDVEVAVGPGVMIQTPVGPLRADWGYRLTDFQSNEKRFAFHIAIGNPF